MKNEVLDIIIPFIEATKNDRPINSENQLVPQMGGTKYLLGQMIRQLQILPNHYFISTKAKALWEQISTKDILCYHYRELVQCENEQEIPVNCYKNNSKIPHELRAKIGKQFIYRDVFHDEHMTPVNDIIERLIAIDTPNYENVSKVLNSIYICKMLKDEDRRLYPKYHRPSEISQIIDKIYTPAGIEIV